MELVVGFSTSRRWRAWSAAIRLIEGTAYSHVYFRFAPTQLSRGFIFHASDDNRNFSSTSDFIEQNRIVEEHAIPVTEQEMSEILQYCIDNHGIRYGKTEVVLAGIEKAFRKMGIRVPNPLKDQHNRHNCLKFVWFGLKFLGEYADKMVVEEGGLRQMNRLVRRIARERRPLSH